MMTRDEQIERLVRREATQMLTDRGERGVARGYDRIALTGLTIVFTSLIALVCLLTLGGFEPYALLGLSVACGLTAGLGLYPLLGLMHDSIHGSMPKGVRIAHLVNYVVAPVLGVSTFTYKRAHLAHHAFLGNKAKDPQYAPFSRAPDDHQELNHLMIDMPISLETPIKNFIAIAVDMSEVFRKREAALFRSLIDPAARRDLYRKSSFLGVPRSETTEDDTALSPEEARQQARLDWMRIGVQVALFVMLFFHPLRYVSIAGFTAMTVAALLNMLRASKEHTGHENEGDIDIFNRYHSSNTGGYHLFWKYVWFPVPWHALHHAAPRVPFFLLGELYRRVASRLAADAANEVLSDVPALAPEPEPEPELAAVE